MFLRKDTEIGKVIVDPFRACSRLKQLVIGKKTRKDHPQVMNAAIRLYADAANARTKMENGFDLTDYDRRTARFRERVFERFVGHRRQHLHRPDVGYGLDFVPEVFQPLGIGNQGGNSRRIWKFS